MASKKSMLEEYELPVKKKKVNSGSFVFKIKAVLS